jgi:hypothetical protein
LINHNQSHNNEKKDKGKKNQNPRDGCVAILADQVQDPCPEKDVKYLYNKDC